MANAQRGEHGFDLDDQHYVLHYSLNRISACETDSPGIRFIELVARLSRAEVGITDIRWLLWAGLQDRHPEVTLMAAGDMLQAKGIDVMMEVIAKAAAACLKPRDPRTPARTTPRRTRRTTGRRSSSTP